MATSHMTITIFSAIVVMLLSSAIAAQSSGDVGGKPKPTDFMVRACKSASNYSRGYNDGIGYVTSEFCITTLQSDNRSADAKDHIDLALIPVHILKERLVIAGGNVKEMLHNTKNSTSATVRHLRTCEMEYTASASLLNLCDALTGDYQGDDDSVLTFYYELSYCVHTVDRVSGYSRFALPQIPGAEALVKESKELLMLMYLSMALLEPYE